MKIVAGHSNILVKYPSHGVARVLVLELLLDPADRLPARLELGGQFPFAFTGSKLLGNDRAIVWLNPQRRTKPFPFGLRSCEPRIGALDQKIAFELRYMIDDPHGHLPRSTGEIHTAEREAMDPHASPVEIGDTLADIHGVATEPVELRDDQNVVLFQPI